MTREFDLHCPHGHVTRDGKPARVLCTDAAGSRPIVAAVRFDDAELGLNFDVGGRYNTATGVKHPYDLVNAAEPKPEPIVERRWAVKRDGKFLNHTFQDHVSTVPVMTGASWVRVEIREIPEAEQ